ncbi:hypothetical protein NQZ79_g3982 [Umbelopsis isabellina]|nr:hypothetical protein NQZ79_g3982 [Umbelopsis isabellina]
MNNSRDALTLPEESHTYIGVVVSICGNILISVALNLQKYAHNKLQKKSASSFTHSNGSLPHSSPQIGQNNYDDRFQNCQKSDLEEDNTDYLKSKLWWIGISLMVIGEIGNFVAYGFAPASTIAPLGTTTLVSNVILAPLMLKERFRFRDAFGLLLAVFGATVVVLSSKSEEVKLSPDLVVEYLTSMQAIIYYSITGGLILFLTALSPKYGSTSILIDLGLVALYATAVIQIKYLNKALQRFDSTAVIPTQFVLFTVSAIIGSAVLYRDFDDVKAEQFVRFVAGCLVEFLGVYMITANRRHGESKVANEEDVLPRTARISRRSSVQSSGPSEPYNESLDDEEHDTDTLYSHGADQHLATDTTPLLAPTHYDKQKADDGNANSHGSERIRKSSVSVFRGISLVSQLAGMDDESFDATTSGQHQLSTSQSSKRHRAVHAVGHLLHGIIPSKGHKRSAHDGTDDESDAIPIEIPPMEEENEVASSAGSLDLDIDFSNASDEIQMRRSTSHAMKEDQGANR